MSRQVIVVGAGLGGLSAAIYSRLQGWDVTVVEQNSVPGGKAQQKQVGEFTFDLGPSIIILTEIYDQLFASAGKRLEDYLRFQRLDPITRVFFDSEDPLDLPADYESCLEAVESLSACDAESLRHLIKGIDTSIQGLEQAIFGLPIDRPWDLFRPGFVQFGLKSGTMAPFKRRVDKLFTHPLLKAFFYGFPSYGGQSWKSVSPGAFLIPYFMMRRGVWQVEGGVGAIPQAITRLAQDLGVEFKFDCQVNGVVLENRKVKSVKTIQGQMECEALISNRCRTALQPLLGRLKARSPSLSYMTLSMGLSELVSGLQHHSLLMPREFEQGFEDVYEKHQFPSRPIVYINQTDPKTLFAAVTCPADEPAMDWQNRTGEYRQRILDELVRHGFRTEIREEIVQTPLDFEQRDGNFKGSLYGPIEKQRLWGILPERCRDEEISNLFYVGGSVQPGAGMPMVVLSGKFAAGYLGPA